MNTVAESLKPLKKAADLRNFREFIDYIAKAYGEKTAFKLKKKGPGKEVSYREISYTELRREIYALGAALVNHGLNGKRIALIGNNCYEWILVYLSVLCSGGKIIPLDKGLPYEEFEMSVKRSDADVIFYGKGYQKFIDQLDGIASIPTQENAELSLASLLQEGLATPDANINTVGNIEIDELCPSIYIFTSGTTSMAKAVMLSQRNIMANLHDLAEVEDIRYEDVNIAFLPYHHTFGLTGQLVMLRQGATTVYCDGLKYIQKNMVEYGVSVFVSVPLIIESIYKRILSAAEKQGQMKKLQFGMKLSGILLKVGIDVRRKLFASVHEQLGGQLRTIINGAAAINPEVVKGMDAFGIEAFQGYGMTESSPVLAAENTKTRRPGSIGKAIPSVQIQIDEPDEEGVGELIAKGPNVMLGYMNNEEETAIVLRDGWLHTGDLAYIDDDGYIFLRGRKKNVIVLKNGKNVYPEEIENLLGDLPYVSECMVFPQSRKGDGDDVDLVLAAKIYCDGETSDSIRERAEADLDAINAELPKYKRIHRLIISDEPMVKTTTGKIKRYEEMKKEAH